MTIKLTLKEFKDLVQEVTKEIVKEEEASSAVKPIEHKSMSLKEFRLLVKKLVLEEIKKK